MRQSSTKIITSASDILGFIVCLIDNSQAYLQSKYKMSREVFVRSHSNDLKYFDMNQHTVHRSRKPLYGMCDSGGYWGATISEHIRENLQMKPLDGDPSYYLKKKESKTMGLLGSYVDGFLFAGGPDFLKVVNEIMRRLGSKPIEWNDFDFLGIRIRFVNKFKQSSSFSPSQPDCFEALKELPTGLSFSGFRSARAAVSWYVTRDPKILFRKSCL